MAKSKRKESEKHKDEYKRQRYDQIIIRVPKGQREEWKAAADRHRLTLAEMVRRAVAFYLSALDG